MLSDNMLGAVILSIIILSVLMVIMLGALC
jgi:hypothetical protein